MYQNLVSHGLLDWRPQLPAGCCLVVAHSYLAYDSFLHQSMQAKKVNRKNLLARGKSISYNQKQKWYPFSVAASTDEKQGSQGEGIIQGYE